MRKWNVRRATGLGMMHVTCRRVNAVLLRVNSRLQLTHCMLIPRERQSKCLRNRFRPRLFVLWRTEGLQGFSGHSQDHGTRRAVGGGVAMAYNCL